MKLRTKLLLSYFLLLSIAFVLFYAISVPLVRNYIRERVTDNLEQERILVRSRTLEALSEVESREDYIRALVRERNTVERLGLSSTMGYFYYSRNAAEISSSDSHELSPDTKATILKKIQDKDPDPFGAVINGKDSIAVFFIASPQPSGQRVFIILYTPTEAIQTFTRGFIRIMVIVFLIILAVAIIIALVFAGRINKPVKKLKLQAGEFRKRNFSARTDIKTGDEFQSLSETMNSAAEELETHSVVQREFLDNVSHELKTPLMSIQGYAEGIRDGIFEADSGTLEIITDECRRLKNLVGEISYLSKLESMPDVYDFGEIEISEVIERSVDSVSGLENARNIKIVMINLEKHLLQGDGDKLVQLMVNVLSNCLNFAAKTVFIDTSSDDSWYTITIKDDGPGFTPGDEEKVFRRFYKGSGGNRGLGLSIASAIAASHGGSIIARNTSPNGALFEIKLPKNRE